MFLKVKRSDTVGEKARKYLASLAKITTFKITIRQILFVGRLTHPIILRAASHMATNSSSNTKPEKSKVALISLDILAV